MSGVVHCLTTLSMFPACVVELTGLILLPVPGVPAADHLTGVVLVLVQLVLHLGPETNAKRWN